MGPPTYDLVSLLRDSYFELAPGEIDLLLDYYWQRIPPHISISDRQDLAYLFHIQTLQRKLKDAGRFVFIDRMKNNSSFMQYVEPTLGYVGHAFDHLPDYESLRRILARWLPDLCRRTGLR